ncbi:hypothetical protein JCM1841_006705 [Sporobolomyces salmonicolor]
MRGGSRSLSPRPAVVPHENPEPFLPPRLLSRLSSLFLDNLPIDITRHALLAYLPPDSVVGIAINPPVAYRDARHSEGRGSAFLLFENSYTEKRVVQQYVAGQRFPGAPMKLFYKWNQLRDKPWRGDGMEESWMQRHGGLPPPLPPTSSSIADAAARRVVSTGVIGAFLHGLESGGAHATTSTSLGPAPSQQPPLTHEDKRGTKRSQAEQPVEGQGDVVVDPRKRAKH